MMTFLEMRRALRRLFRYDRAEDEARDEMEAHLEFQTQAYIDQGVTAHEARMQARRDFGRQQDVSDAIREVHGGPLARLIEMVQMDGRYALRSLARTPVFTLGVVVSLGLGLAASATMVGLLDRLLFRAPPHVADVSELRRLYLSNPRDPNDQEVTTNASYLRYTELAAGAPQGTEVAAMSAVQLVVGRGVDAQRVPGMIVTPNFFSMAGARPQAGRWFTAEEGTPPAGVPVAVISHGLWERMYDARQDAVGSTLQLGAHLFTIVGVAPKGFSGVDMSQVDVWIPVGSTRVVFGFLPEIWHRQHNFGFMTVVLRAAPAVSNAALEASLTKAYAASMATADHKGVARVIAAPVQIERGPLRTEAAKVTGWTASLSFVLLLIVCANVANLLLARALRRRREIAIRLAMGVSQRRLIGQLLLESGLLAMIGGVGALMLSAWASRAAGQLLTPNAPPMPLIDGRIAAMTLGVALLVGLITGTAPALLGARAGATASLRSSSRAGSYQRSGLRSALVAVQAGLSVVLLVGAGLFVRSLQQVNNADLGFDQRHSLLVQVTMRGEQYDGGREALLDQLALRAKGIAEVTHVSRIQSIPFGTAYQSDFAVPGVDSASTRGEFYLSSVDPDYFTAMGTRILRGRAFNTTDVAGAPLVAIVSEQMAKQFWPRTDAIGQCIRVGGDTLPCSTIVGIAKDARRNGVRPEPTMQYYVSSAQKHPNTGVEGVIVRVAGEGVDAVETVRRTLQEASPGAAFVRVQPLGALVAPSTRSWRLGTAVFGAFGALALIIAGLGLYSVVAYGATQRRHELGVRMALGAPSRHIVGALLNETLRASTIGFAIGLTLSLIGGRWIAPLLFEVSPRDPGIFAMVLAILVLVAAVAALMPARRAVRIDPTTALRSD